MIADNDRGVARASFWHSWISFRLILISFLLLDCAQVLFIVANFALGQSLPIQDGEEAKYGARVDMGLVYELYHSFTTPLQWSL